MRVEQYVTAAGVCPFTDWFDGLNTQAALKVRTAIARMESGNMGDIKPVGSGVSERRIPFGPGYRIYFGKDGDTLVLLLTGGTKSASKRMLFRRKRFGQTIESGKGKQASHGTHS